jgi:hypothetical protein
MAEDGMFRIIAETATGKILFVLYSQFMLQWKNTSSIPMTTFVYDEDWTDPDIKDLFADIRARNSEYDIDGDKKYRMDVANSRIQVKVGWKADYETTESNLPAVYEDISPQPPVEHVNFRNVLRDLYVQAVADLTDIKDNHADAGAKKMAKILMHILEYHKLELKR